MSKHCLTICIFALTGAVQASWYWPFGSDATEEKELPRVSELMEEANRLADIANDLAAEGKFDEAIATNRLVLAELDRIERENPERVKRPEFSTLKHKRANVSASIDSIRTHQARQNAKPVAVSDTTELEKKFAAEQKAKTAEAAKAETAEAAKAKAEGSAAPAESVQPLSRREQAIFDIAKGDYAAAKLVIDEMLNARPNDVLALNLKATMEARRGDLKAAESALDQAIANNPKSYFAYYNMAILRLRANPDDRDAPKRYYETGRSCGGPKDEKLEALLK